MEQVQKQEIELSIIIKTLNEERNIARCIEAILNTLHDITMEIIVADSGSIDRTVDIAASYPVTVVQLANPAERSCGIGPQLGFQHSRGHCVLILDADMVLHATFVRCALARMKSDRHCGGIGGQLVECSGTGYEYDMQRALNNVQSEEVNWLNGSALYRREAILSVGYLSNRNLHAYEEKELGLRLRHAGWHLYRITEVAVDHYGHAIDTVKLLWRRWRSGYADACGESIRACFGKPYLLDMVLAHRTLVVCLFFQLLFLAGVMALSWFSSPLLILIVSLSIVLGTLAQIIRKKSVHAATYSLLYTNVFALGLARGILKPHLNPADLIQSIVLKRSTGHTI
jgi:glycosyltransferase involved in cell wall biosynthesis